MNLIPGLFRKCLIAALFIGIGWNLTCLSAANATAPRYQYTPLDFHPLAINNQGQVVGYYLSENHGVFWSVNGGRQDLNPVGDSYPWSINDLGQVIGVAGNQGFLWTESGGMQNLGAFRPTAINNQGQVAGFSETASHERHAFLWTADEGLQDLGTLGGKTSEATAINNQGQVVGYSNTTIYPAYTNVRPFLWTASEGMQDIGSLGGSWAMATAINDQGQVGGESNRPYDPYNYDPGYYNPHAFFWTPLDGMQDIGVIPQDLIFREHWHSHALSINNQGHVLGQLIDHDWLHCHAFFWSPQDGMVRLTPPGAQGSIVAAYYYDESWRPKKMNNRGEVVGIFEDNTSGNRAFYWSKEAGGTIDLNSLVVNLPPGKILSRAMAINDKGQIVGMDDIGNGFLLNPEMTVTIDIKPGSDVNSINPDSKGKIAVAVLSSANFDATTQVNRSSLTFGHSGGEESLAFCTVEDVNGDGVMDLVAHFYTQSTAFEAEDIQGILRGETIDGNYLTGIDTIRIVHTK